MSEIFTRMIELATDRGDSIVHLFGDNRSMLDLADMLGRNIFAIQPDVDSALADLA